MFPTNRMRRLRSSQGIRSLTNETRIDCNQLIMPLFFDESLERKRECQSMPGVFSHPLNECEDVANRVVSNGIGSVLVFGVPKTKDAQGTMAFDDRGPAQMAIRGLKESSDLLVIADLCLCEYTSHGHCGHLENGDVDNDSTLDLYGRVAISLADSGADIVAPSGMMDGQVAHIRRSLDDAGFKDIAIMAYSAKYKSAFYGPFRDVACSAPSFGDRSTYQMQCGNRREAMMEMELDVREGADILMVKPAMAYLDIIRDARERFDLPLAAYQVSGEYAMIRHAARMGCFDEGSVIDESLTSIARAGADMIITYFAEEHARRVKDGF